MRAYAGLEVAQVVALSQGKSVEADLVFAETPDEADELAALEAAAEGTSVVAALDPPVSPFSLSDVAAFHVDDDGSGHLQWFARQEVEAVIDLLG